MGLDHIPTEQLRDAVMAWKDAYKPRWPFPGLSPSLWERIDEMVDEIARLREARDG